MGIAFKFKEAASLGIFSNKTLEISLIEVFFSTIISIILAFMSSYLKKKNFLNKIGMALKVTERFGIEDLWYEFNQIKEIEWVTVRDHKVTVK